MFNEKQVQESGDSSVNYQSSGDITINNQGLSYSEVKDVAMSIFKSNFYDLGKQVEHIVNERAEKLLGDYLKKIEKEKPQALINTTDPDIRYGILEAQKAYARSGKDYSEEIMVELLFERTANQNSEMKRLLLNESLVAADKVTELQLDLLSISFILRVLGFTEPKDPLLYTKLLLPFSSVLNSNDDKYSDYTYLSYLGCGDISIGSADFNSLILTRNLIDFSNEIELNKNLPKYPILRSLKTFWDGERQMKHFSLSPIGCTLAIVNINKKSGLDLSLDLAL